MFNRSKREWAKIAKQREKLENNIKKMFIEQKWPTKSIVCIESSAHTDDYLIYDKDKEFNSVADYYKKYNFFHNPHRDLNIDILSILTRDENGACKVENDRIFVLPYKNIEELKAEKVLVMVNGPEADYPILYTAYSKLSKQIQFLESNLVKCLPIDYYRFEKLFVPVNVRTQDIYFKDGSKFNGDLIDLCIALNDVYLKDIKTAIDELAEIKKQIDSESKQILNEFFRDMDPKLATDKLYSEL